MTQTLFSPLVAGDLHLPNRIVMAPLTRSRAGAGNVPGPLAALYYAQRASAGLLISEATQVIASGQGYPSTPGIHSAEQIAGWQRVTAAVHAAGGRIVLQLWHVGRISHRSFQPGGALPVAPSAIRPAGQVFIGSGMADFETPRALETAELPAIVQAYVDGAANAIAAGFDGVEIHAANGYLLDQFLRDGSNRRDDAYGGSIENRTRLLREVIAAVTARIGAGRTGMRISPEQTFNDMHDSAPQALFNRVAEIASEAGLAYLHVLEGDIAGGPGAGVDYGAIRQRFHGAYLANHAYTGERAAQAIASGRVDAVAFGKAFIANPDLVTRLQLGAALNQADQATFYGGDAKGYTDYPLLAAL
ncbi:MAG: alkene reductase [Pseudomonadota bacterium]|nr:alkene reductase [Pseudomonadota bacterium]